MGLLIFATLSLNLLTPFAVTEAHAESACSLPLGEGYNIFIKSTARGAADIRLQDASNSFFVRHYIDKDGVMGLRLVVTALSKMSAADLKAESGQRAEQFLRNRIKLLKKSHDVRALEAVLDDARSAPSMLQAATESFLKTLKNPMVDARDSDQDDEKTRKLNALEENIPYSSTTCRTVLNSFEIDQAYGTVTETKFLDKIVTLDGH